MKGREPRSSSLSPRQCLVLSLLLAACTRQPDTLHPLTLLSPTGQRIDLQVELADDHAERSRGLMFREELPEGQGMLFVFKKPQMLSFWMKDTRIPLDILFFDAGGQFVSARTMEPCRSDPCPMYPSAADAQYALEVPAGFVEYYNSYFPLVIKASVSPVRYSTGA